VPAGPRRALRLGAPLTRLEAAVALKRLFTRFPGLGTTDAPLTYRSGFVGNNVRALPVRLRDP
jgi:2-hydroxy-5-methyl-1-naphthoate 7-hydroxylase